VEIFATHGHVPSPNTALTPAAYQRLLAHVRGLLQRGRLRAELAFAQQLVATYHALGAYLLEQELTDNAGYGAATLQRLADDLRVSQNVLYAAVSFARTYRGAPPESGLRWAHYRELLTVHDPKARGWYESEAAKQGWTRNQLVEAIRAKRFPAHSPPKPKRPVRKKRAKRLEPPSDPMHYYKARVVRVIDGDTLLADVDLGFGIRKEQRLRLALLDTPEIDTPAGAKAKQYVQDRLATVEFIVVRTVKTDLHGRFVADVFYLPGEPDKHIVSTQGLYLNQELIDQGHAIRCRRPQKGRHVDCPLKPSSAAAPRTYAS